MKFCYQCGNPVSEANKFCPKCGAKLNHAPSPAAVNESVVQEYQPEKKRRCNRNGVIFTNMTALSIVLNTRRDVVRQLLQKYVDTMTASDIQYQLVDASDYTFISRKAGLKGKRVSLMPSNPWWEHQQILFDILSYEKENRLPESNYLFIIGGHDIIPVAAINHYAPGDSDGSDTDIETDLLYAYPYGPHTQYSLESLELYKNEMYFLPGRLPIPVGSGVNYLENYLTNSVKAAMGGLNIRKIYAQSDPHWQEATAATLRIFEDAGLLADKSGIRSEYRRGNIMLGPGVTSQVIDQAFDTDCDLVFLNQHGSNAKEQPGYWGQDYEDDWYETFPVYAPGSMTNLNVFVAEACYGGRFIGHDIDHSIIQTALSNKTVIAMASSRVAYGSTDQCIQAGWPESLWADNICMYFTYSLLSGLSAGESMIAARLYLFNNEVSSNQKMVRLSGATTMAEFNLYGDPSLRLSRNIHGKTVTIPSKKIIPEKYECGFSTKVLKGAAKKAGLLDQIRSEVDANIAFISDNINKELYEKMGIPPREPKTICKVTYGNKIEELRFTYTTEGKVAQYQVVTTDKDGNISSIATSK